MHEKVFTIEEARTAIPVVRVLLEKLLSRAEVLQRLNPAVDKARKASSQNGGSEYGPLYLEHAFGFAEALEQIQDIGAIVKDLGTGLVDFPHEHDGRLVYLCWKLGEDDLGWWHEIDDGFAGRQPIEDSFERSH